MESKYREPGRNPIGGTAGSVKMHFLVIYAHHYYCHAFDFSPVKKFKSISAKMVEKKARIVHEKIHLFILVLYDHSAYCGYIFRVKFS